MEAAKGLMSPSELLSVAEIEGKGRGLVASQPLKAGQIILRDSPIVIYSALPLRQNQQENNSSPPFRYCAHCFRTLGQDVARGCSSAAVHICPSCSHPDDAVFCSAKCQSLALSSTHTRWTCQALKYLRNCSHLVEQQADEVQVQARYLVSAYNLAMVAPSNFQKLLSLDGGSGSSCSSSVESKSASVESNTLVGFLHSVMSSIPLPNGVTAPSVELTRELLGKDSCNAFGLMEPFSENRERSVRAYGIYPNASFFNHDCLPNACRFDYVDSSDGDCNTEIIVRMIHDVPQGREICLSYFPVNLRYSERQKRLVDDYGFVCDCDRCKVEANWSDKEEEDDDEAMEEEDGDDQQMDGYEEQDDEIDVDDNEDGNGDNDFPHAYFFVKYMCSKENCGGTLAPLLLPPSNGIPTSNVMECNVCGALKNEDELQS